MPNSRTYLDPDRRRQSLLEAARRVFHRGGLTAITNNEVAHEAGVSRALVYSFFPDNDALLAAFFEERVQRFRAVTREVDERAADPVGRSVWALRMMLDLPLDELTSFKELMAAHGGAALQGVQEQFRLDARTRWNDAIDFRTAPTGVTAALYLFIEITVQMAICVQDGEMVADGAEALLRALTIAAMDHLAAQS
jgi:AcrR family transcriptional regulator